MKWLNSLEKQASNKKIAKQRKRFIKRYKNIFKELDIKPFSNRK
jgi:hypothetical protein